jgi:hypothetical protein
MIFAALSENQAKHSSVIDSLKDKFSYKREYSKNSTKLGLIYEVLNKAIKENNLSDQLHASVNTNHVVLKISYKHLSNLENDPDKYNRMVGVLNSIIYNFDRNAVELQASFLETSNSLEQPSILNENTYKVFFNRLIKLYNHITKNYMNNALSLNILISPLSDTDSNQLNKTYYPNIQINIYEKDNK